MFLDVTLNGKLRIYLYLLVRKSLKLKDEKVLFLKNCAEREKKKKKDL